MAQRRQIRVSRSLEGGGERPARRYGVTPSRLGRVNGDADRLKPVLLAEDISGRARAGDAAGDEFDHLRGGAAGEGVVVRHHHHGLPAAGE